MTFDDLTRNCLDIGNMKKAEECLVDLLKRKEYDLVGNHNYKAVRNIA